jgi:hypothetical protein
MCEEHAPGAHNRYDIVNFAASGPGALLPMLCVRTLPCLALTKTPLTHNTLMTRLQ